LELAVSNGHIDAVRILLDHGAPAANPGGSYCWLSATLDGRQDIADLLKQRGVNVELKDWQWKRLKKRESGADDMRKKGTS
jgi:hypothetical protein